MTLRPVPILVVVLSLVGEVAFAQSAAELAEREKRRREALQREGVKARSFSDDDLEGRSGSDEASDDDSPRSRSSSSGETTSEVPEHDGGSEGSNDSGDDDSGLQAPASADVGMGPWARVADLHRIAVDEAQAELEEAEAALREAQGQRGPQRQPGLADDLSQDPDHRLTRDASLDELRDAVDEARAALDEALQAQADFETEARRKRVPPGWIR